MNSELRQRRSLNGQLLDAGAIGHEGDELPGNFEDDPPAPLLDQRRIADELQGITQALLGIDQDAASRQGRAVPLRYRKRTWPLVSGTPAPFILGPAARKVSLGQPGQGSIEAGLGVVGLQLQGAVI